MQGFHEEKKNLYPKEAKDISSNEAAIHQGFRCPFLNVLSASGFPLLPWILTSAV